MKMSNAKAPPIPLVPPSPPADLLSNQPPSQDITPLQKSTPFQPPVKPVEVAGTVRTHQYHVPADPLDDHDDSGFTDKGEETSSLSSGGMSGKQ